MHQKFEDLLNSRQTLVMGILNITPNSFSGDGLLFSDKINIIDVALDKAERMIAQGCHLLDIGAESSKPGAEILSAQEELDRLLPVVDAICYNFDIPISVDTRKAVVARHALELGAVIVNDISGLQYDSDMVNLVAEKQCYTIFMHSAKRNGNIQSSFLGTRYIADPSMQSSLWPVHMQVFEDLRLWTDEAIHKGLSPEKIIIDIGIGFEKTTEENFALLNHMDFFQGLGFPMLIGVSRKSVIGYTSGAPFHQRLGGSIAALSVGILKGAKIVRVHDVYESVQAAQFIDCVLNDRNI